MIETIKDWKGNLLAVLEYWLVDDKGQQLGNRDYVWINDLYINPDLRNNGIIKQFIKKVIKKNPQAKWGYFVRGKYKDRMSLYSRRKWIKLLNKGDTDGRQ